MTTDDWFSGIGLVTVVGKGMVELSPIVSKFATTEEAEAYDVWFRAKVQASINDPRPRIPHNEVMARIDVIIERAERRLKAG